MPKAVGRAFSGVLCARASAAQKRAEFCAALKSGRLLRFPGAFSPLVGMAIERWGFAGRLHLWRGVVGALEFA